jgi:hypothetical protein
MSGELTGTFLGSDTGQLLDGARERVSSPQKSSGRLGQRGLLPQL